MLTGFAFDKWNMLEYIVLKKYGISMAAAGIKETFLLDGVGERALDECGEREQKFFI